MTGMKNFEEIILKNTFSHNVFNTSTKEKAIYLGVLTIEVNQLLVLLWREMRWELACDQIIHNVSKPWDIYGDGKEILI
jgi:hypothetical protein